MLPRALAQINAPHYFASSVKLHLFTELQCGGWVLEDIQELNSTAGTPAD